MLIKKCVKYCIFILFLAITSKINAQEHIEFNTISVSPEIKVNYQQNTKSTADTLLLPFFEDFSTTQYYPDASKWTDYNTFINSTYSINPPSIGVATFDAVKFDGSFYPGASYNQAFYSDELTSKPFKLKEFTAASKIFISFFYQPQGNGDVPETSDSLILYFFAPNQNKWKKIWEKAGSQRHDFKQVILPIADTAYLQNGFKIKFQNKASLSSATFPGKVSNCDHWNLDYIKINKNRSIVDTIYNDLAFYEAMQSFVKNYEAIPLRHFKDTSVIKSKVNIKFRNNNNTERYIDLVYFKIKSINENKTDTIKAGSRMTLPGKSSDMIPFGSKTYAFETARNDTARFEIECGLKTDDFDSVSNNKTTYTQYFFDYYAYDDGSAEMGYGLSGEGTQNAQLAYKFVASEKDTLKSLQLYFNQSLNLANQKYFFLMVWDNDPNTGKPGNLIYQQEGAKPQITNLLNKYYEYPFDTLLILEDTFYVGIMQTTTEFLNIGFDINRISNQNLYYNISGTWISSKITGALMIRPVFGKSLFTNISETKLNSIDFNFYPNPATDMITIELPENEIYQDLTINIFNVQGKLVKQSINQKQICVSNLPEGMYILNIRNKKQTVSKKLIIEH